MLFRSKSIGWQKIQQHEKRLTAYALAALRSIPGLTILGPHVSKERSPIFSFTITGIHPHDGATLLDKEGIAVRGGHHCTQILHDHYGVAGSMRASLALYNTQEEIDRLVSAIRKVQEKLYG